MKNLTTKAMVCALVGLAATVSAQDVYSGNILGYATNGAGFAFSPVTGVSVTALGYVGTDILNAPYEVSLWDASGDQLASALISTNNTLSGPGYFQSTSPLALTAGNTYYLGAVRPDIGLWLGNVIISSGPEADGTFEVAPQITYLGCAATTDTNGVFPGFVGDSSTLFVGADFAFQLPSGGVDTSVLGSEVPEPAVPALAGCALAAVWLGRRRSSPVPPLPSAGGSRGRPAS
ncbi:MAG TPA: DUF4082 domain-containing protein [Candidatus Acidoferrum sp.]|nr:DUF4082 domain-containing protein [Candidatus Acidoferrum sp.]